MTFYSARYHTRKTLFSDCTSIISVMEYLSPKMGEFDLQQIYEMAFDINDYIYVFLLNDTD